MGSRGPFLDRGSGTFALEVSPLSRRSAILSRRLPALAAAVWVCLGSAGASAAGSAAAPGDPRAPVESLHAVLLDCMKGACGPDFEGRYERIVAQLDESFDLNFMARVSLGSAWNSLSAEERKTFLALSRRLSATNYAANFDGYDGQHFETLGEEPAARGTLLVKTELVQPNDDDVRFDYRLRQVDGSWRVIDIALDGKISEITLRRSEYGSVVKREGFAKLVEALERKIAKLAAE
jgi:phospholipid transport system substrate-binding protein